MRSINPICYIGIAVKEISIQQANSPIPEISLVFPTETCRQKSPKTLATVGG
jgi:hypothetical protein